MKGIVMSATLPQAIQILTLINQRLGTSGVQALLGGPLADLCDAAEFLEKIDRKALRGLIGIEDVEVSLRIDYGKSLHEALSHIVDDLNLQEENRLEPLRHGSSRDGSPLKELNRAGIKDVRLKLRYISDIEHRSRIGEMERDGHAPANVREIVELALQYPHLPQWMFTVVGLGTHVLESGRPRGRYDFAAIYKKDDKFHLSEVGFHPPHGSSRWQRYASVIDA